jgi:hypothetical protein
MQVPALRAAVTCKSKGGGPLERAGIGPSRGLLARPSLSSRSQMQRRLRGWTEKRESSNIRHPFKASSTTYCGFRDFGDSNLWSIDLHNYSIWFWFSNRLPSHFKSFLRKMGKKNPIKTHQISIHSSSR